MPRLHFVARALRSEQGIVLLAVLAAVLILTVLLSALVVSAIDESSIAGHQRGGTQALFLAEAGAYRALAELRHRVAVTFDAGLAEARAGELRSLCEEDRSAPLVAKFDRADGDRWVEDPVDGSVAVRLNGGDPLAVRAVDGRETGRFLALIRLRSAPPPGGEKVCASEDAASQRYDFWFTYEIESVGITPHGRRAVRFASHRGAPIALPIERAAVSRWALLVLGRSDIWLTGRTVIDGPAHTNGQWWIAGSPTLRGGATSVAQALRFSNCGSPIESAAAANPGVGVCSGDRPAFLGGDLRLAAPPVALPAHPPNLGRAALGLDADGAPVTEGDIRVAAPGQVKTGQEAGRGVYIANDDGLLRHPETHAPTGIYIRGDIAALRLEVEGGRQVLLIRLAGSRTGAERRILLDPEAKTLAVEDERSSVTFQGVGNGLLYVDGKIASLSGIIHRRTRLAIVARGSITISERVVYEDPPGADRGADSLLGLYTEQGDVLINGEVAPEELSIDAAVAAPRGSLSVPDLDGLPDKGALHVRGALVLEEVGAVGELDPGTDSQRGYRLHLTYDWRLREQVPPFFPLTDRYAISWPQPNPLYAKPVWEEIPVP
jgi:hypothetical protein